MSHFKECRMYENRFPEVDECVMVQVTAIEEVGAYVVLLEYGHIEGMIMLSELSRRRIRSVSKIVRVGRQEVCMVLRVDKEKGYIDLSKRRVSEDDIVACDERYNKSKTVRPGALGAAQLPARAHGAGLRESGALHHAAGRRAPARGHGGAL